MSSPALFAGILGLQKSGRPAQPVEAPNFREAYQVAFDTHVCILARVHIYI